MATGSAVLRSPVGEIAARGGVAGVSITHPGPVADVRPHSLTSAQWEALYGPNAATWGVSDVRPKSLNAGATAAP